MTNDAQFSPDGRYRYTLTRDIPGCDGPPVLFLMLNPSKAGTSKNDPTATRCMGFARRENAHQLWIGNPFALVATKPDDIRITVRHKPEAAIGPENDWFLRSMVERIRQTGGKVVAAWGAHAFAQPRINEMLDMLEARFDDLELWALGVTVDGHPRHPLYLAGESRLRRWHRPVLDGRG